MRLRYLYLLIYLLGCCFGTSRSQSNATCTTNTCSAVPDPSTNFLQCVGLSSTDTGSDHLQRLKGMLEAMMDVYTFMRSSIRGVPVLSLHGELDINPGADPLQNEDLVQMWVEVKIVPLLKSTNKHFLSCLSTKNFSCSTYQTMVKELSIYYSDMDPDRQKWTYTFFMYPFLSGDRVDGCARPDEGSEDWLIKNFGAFRVNGRIKDFLTLNMNFSGLEVLHMLTGAQKAELLLTPELAGLDNATLALVFDSLLTGGSSASTTYTTPGVVNNWTSSDYPPTNLPQHTYNPYLPSSSNSNLRQVMSGFMTAFQPLGSFVHEFVSFTKSRDVSEIKSTTLTQFLLNWTLAELANMYQPQNPYVALETTATFDATNMGDWYQQVVMPVLRRFAPNDASLMHENVKFAFEEVFYLDYGDANRTEIQDVCSITLDKSPCGLTNAVENLAKVLNCAARSNLTMSGEEVMSLLSQLTTRLNSLIAELSRSNFTEVASDFQQIFAEAYSPTLTEQHMDDPNFIKLWFQIKLMPLLPNVPPALLSCLSTKNFSCTVYQTIVAALSKQMSFMNAYPEYNQNIYKYFIYPFLVQHNTFDPQCFSGVNRSAEWLENNFGFFLKFAPVTDLYKLNKDFSGLEVLNLLSPKQIAEMLLLPLPTPPEKDVIINQVFDFLVQSPETFPEVLNSLIQLTSEVNPPCSIYKQIFERLYGAISSLPVDMEPVAWAGIGDLINIAPAECVPSDIVCPLTLYNATSMCAGVDSSDLQSYLNMNTDVSCNFPLEKYACGQLGNFTASQLVSLLTCNLTGNSSHSKSLWKMVLSKLSFVLDPALDILGNESMAVDAPSAMELLDVIAEMRLSFLTNQQLMNSSVIKKWFSSRLSRFLPSASRSFLFCLSHRNLSCELYQQILQVFILHFDHITVKSVVLKDFILSFLLQPNSGPGCVNSSINSTEWLNMNLGPFSTLLTVRELLEINPQFQPLVALPFLTPKQSAELLVLTDSTLPDKGVIINALFDFLTELPAEKTFSEFLVYLVMLLPQGNLSCSSYKTLFARLDLAMATVSLNLVPPIATIKTNISKNIPAGCIIYSGQCNATIANASICANVNSTTLQLYINSGNINGRFCDFAVEQIACASLSAITAQDLAGIMMCNRPSNSSGSKAAWSLLLTKTSFLLDQALDILSTQTLDPRNPALSVILNTIQQLQLGGFTAASLNDPSYINLWFGNKLGQFLPAVSPDFLFCLTTNSLTCSSYQQIVQALGRAKPYMTLAMQMPVYTHLIKVYLTENTTDPSCSSDTTNSSDWLLKNLGPFASIVPFQDLQLLYPKFKPLDALPQLSPRQLAALSATPGLLTSSSEVNLVTNLIPNQLLPAFFDDFTSAVTGHENLLSSPVTSALLQVVFDRANLYSASDSEVSVWLIIRLHFLLKGMPPSQVEPFFGIIAERNCSVVQQGVGALNEKISSFSADTKDEIYKNIIRILTGPPPLRCYGSNYTISYYSFLKQSFMGFQFPSLTTFLLLAPPDTRNQLLNSIPPSELGSLLSRPGFIDNSELLCAIYKNYIKIDELLTTVPLPTPVMQLTLPCVWSMALSSSTKSDISAWFDENLKNYLVFLTKDLIAPSVINSSSCLVFQKLVFVLGGLNYTSVDFEKSDVYNSIRAYLTSDTDPRCYNPTDPDLNSTAWFAQYLGIFISFLTLDDLQTLGSENVIQVFTVNLLNIALLNQSTLPVNLTNYYTELVYRQDSNFNPVLLPLVCQCLAPGPAFTQLISEESMVVLQKLNRFCTDLDPQIAAALAGNLGNSIDASELAALGNESISLSMGQIMSIKPMDLFVALGTLSTVQGWDQGQASAIIQALVSSGLLQMDSSSKLLMLGSLIEGIPASVFSSIGGTQLIAASTDPLFLTNLIAVPQIIQQAFVSQIVSVNTNSETIIQNVPDQVASAIPRDRLLGFTDSSNVVTTLNKKKWKGEQVELFFDVIAVETATAALGSPNNLSSSLLQGFTCTGVRAVTTTQIKKLIKACRRSGSNKVQLVETQLTCMYNHIKGDADVTSYTLYPPDVLLYYDYSLVPQASCRLYFQQLANADFSVFSSTLSYKQTSLFANAQSCLGITNTSLTRDNILVLGNMVCTLDGSYIQNSDPYILEQLKSCPDLTDAQAAAAQALLLSGNTQYRAPSTWNDQTLVNLGMLPLYLTSTFYSNFDKKTKQRFLKYFLNVLKSNGVSQQKRRRLKQQLRLSLKTKSKRSTADVCTVGIITHVTVSDPTFPFSYDDINQFNSCLSASTVKDNLYSITQKVDQLDYLRIVLNKLQEAYGATSTIPEDQVQLLGPASRVATIDDISQWNIARIDTLASLMDTRYGQWDPSLARAIISKYLKTAGNTLGSAELNTIGGDNLCSLDLDVLKNISQQSIQQAGALNVSNCTAEKQQALFNIAVQAFTPTTRATSTVSSYQLLKPYISGANLTFILNLVGFNVNMDIATFTSLNPSIVLNLNVTQVSGLLGNNLPDLKAYEKQSLIQSWIRSQRQSDLNSLGVGLVGGLADPTTTNSPTTATTNSPSATTSSPSATTSSPLSSTTTAATTGTTSAATTTAKPGSSSTTSNSSSSTSDCTRIRADAAFSFLLLLALFISRHTVM